MCYSSPSKDISYLLKYNFEAKYLKKKLMIKDKYILSTKRIAISLLSKEIILFAELNRPTKLKNLKILDLIELF